MVKDWEDDKNDDLGWARKYNKELTELYKLPKKPKLTDELIKQHVFDLDQEYNNELRETLKRIRRHYILLMDNLKKTLNQPFELEIIQFHDLIDSNKSS